MCIPQVRFGRWQPIFGWGMLGCLLACPVWAQDDFPPLEPAVRRNPVEVEPTRDADDFDVPPDTPATTDGGATLNPVLLSQVRDNTVGLEYTDRPAYYYGLWLSQQLAPSEIQKLALQFRDQRQAANPTYKDQPRAKFPQFVDIFQHPEAYRGRAVTMQGYFRKLIKYDAGPNDLGIGEVYEGWFYNENSQSNPAVVVFTQLPEGFPLGADITEEVRFSGYFLKMYGYGAQDTTRKAPLFVAGSVQWFPARKANERQPVSPWVYGLMTGIAIVAVWALWHSLQRPKRELSRFHSPGRDYDGFPPQEFLGDGDSRPTEPHH